MAWKKDEQPKTPQESFENLMNLTIRKHKESRSSGPYKWTAEELENVFGKQEDIYDFLWQTSSENNPDGYYIKTLEEGTAGPTGDINRPYYQNVEGAADTMGVFLHNLLPDFRAENTHSYQKSMLGNEKFNKLLEDQQDLITRLSLGPKTWSEAQRETYDIPFTKGYNLENLAHGVGGVGGLEQLIKTLTDTKASEPFGGEEEETFLDAISNLIGNLR